MRKKVIEIISATNPDNKDIKHDVIVLSEKLPQTGPRGLILRGSGMPGFLHDFFKGEQWMRIQDAGDCTVSGLLRFENLISHRVFIGNNNGRSP